MKVLTVIWSYVSATPTLWVVIGFALLWAIKRYVPGSDKYIGSIYVTLDEIDRLIDFILDEYENLPHINTVDDVVTRVKNTIARVYGIDPDDEKVKKELMKRLDQDERFDFSLKDGEGKIDFTKKF